MNRASLDNCSNERQMNFAVRYESQHLALCFLSEGIAFVLICELPDIDARRERTPAARFKLPGAEWQWSNNIQAASGISI
jgi:hypothetical protein